MKKNRIIEWIENFSHGRRYFAVGSGTTAFLILLGASQARGIPAGWTLTSWLLVASGLVALLTYTYLLARAEASLRSALTRTDGLEISQDLDSVTARIEPKEAQEVRTIVGRLVTKNVELQNELSKRQVLDLGEAVLIGGGAFVMGTDNGSPEEGPAKSVLVSAFMMDKYPVTNEQFWEFVSDPSNRDWNVGEVTARYGIPYYLVEWGKSGPDRAIVHHPVVWVGWYASAAFCNWRSRKDKREEVYHFISLTEVESDFSRSGWRLPTEAEWEKAARAGVEGDSLSVQDGRLSPVIANYGKYHKGTTRVGSFPPNAFGVYDIFGNVKEWCHDWYCGDLFKTAAILKDPAGAASGEARAFRGGGWLDEPDRLFPWRRGKLPPTLTNPDFGFRCVRVP